MIKNPDGSVYSPSGSLQQFDPTNLEHDLFNVWDQEVIEIGGSPVYYHQIFINTASIDPLYLEARDKMYSPHGVKLYSFYEPNAAQNYMNVFGVDSPDEMMFEFNYRHVLQELKAPPKIHGLIYTPHKGEYWKIIQRNVQIFKLWGELRLQVMCTRFQESLTTGEGKAAPKYPSYKVNDVKDLASKKTNFAGGQP